MVRDEPIPAASFTFGTLGLAAALSSERASLDTRLRGYFGKETYLSRLMAWLSPTTRTRLLSFGTRQMNFHGALFRVPKQNVESLRAKVLQCAPSGMHVSENDIVTAIISKVIAQAARDMSTKSAGIGNGILSRLHRHQESRPVTIACDIRYRLGISHINYIGNGQFVPTVCIPVAMAVVAATPQSLYEISVMVRQAVDSATPERIAAFIDVANSHPVGFMCPYVDTDSVASSIGVSNQTRFGVYETDFGFGAPEFVTIDPEMGPGLVSILPACSPSTDYYISICHTEKVINGLRRNEFWNGIAECVF